MQLLRLHHYFQMQAHVEHEHGQRNSSSERQWYGKTGVILDPDVHEVSLSFLSILWARYKFGS